MRFWRGLLWGGLIGSAVGLVLSGRKPAKKTVITKQLKSTADSVVKSARRMKRRMLKG